MNEPPGGTKDQARPMSPEAQVSVAGLAWLRRQLWAEGSQGTSKSFAFWRAWIVLGIVEREQR